MRRRVIAGVIGLLLATVVAGPASASTGEPDMDPQVAAVMAEVPGGVLIDSHHAIWPGLDMELVVPRSSGAMARSAVGPCADGYVCVYANTSPGGAFLRWTTCGYHAIPATFVARSVADARATGSVQARSGTSVLASAPAGGWASIPIKPDNVLCFF
ncbi:MAG: hypothetical protein J7484_13800 [Microbacterium sp.]|nr:hypothetical protein [Microbacterium sp.]